MNKVLTLIFFVAFIQTAKCQDTKPNLRISAGLTSNNYSFEDIDGTSWFRFEDVRINNYEVGLEISIPISKKYFSMGIGLSYQFGKEFQQDELFNRATEVNANVTSDVDAFVYHQAFKFPIIFKFSYPRRTSGPYVFIGPIFSMNNNSDFWADSEFTFRGGIRGAEEYPNNHSGITSGIGYNLPIEGLALELRYTRWGGKDDVTEVKIESVSYMLLVYF